VPAPPPGAAPEAAAAPGAPAAPAAPGNWYDKFSADAFVDAYGSLNYNFPKPAAGMAASGLTLQSPPGFGGNAYRAFDQAQWFSLNWAGVNVSYAADPIGFTVGARVGPGAIIYHTGTPDQVAGLQYVKQAYATWKAASKLTLDFGKFDQPFGSEVADSQLNMNYSRSLLFWYIQPLFFTGLRATVPFSDQVSLIGFAANGWNNSIDINAGKAFGAQLMIKPADQFIAYIGYVGSPEQPDVGVTMTGTPPMPALGDAHTEGNWRHMVDLVLDINPTKDLRFLLNADYRTEDNVAANHSAIAYGANLVIRYAFSDAFYASVRGEYFHDEHGDLLPPGLLPPQKADLGDGTLTLTYALGSHLAFMLDAVRFDVFDNPYFYKNADVTNTTKTQITTTLGVIASTK
jgi:hypothetical protein